MRGCPCPSHTFACGAEVLSREENSKSFTAYPVCFTFACVPYSAIEALEQRYREKESFRLKDSISGEALEILIELGLGQTRASEAIATYKQSFDSVAKEHADILQQKTREIKEQIEGSNELLVGALMNSLADAAVSKFT